MLDLMDRIDTIDLDSDSIETQEWFDSLDYVLNHGGQERAMLLLRQLGEHARRRGLAEQFSANTPYTNTIAANQQPEFPGDLKVEERIENILRWNAMAMVVRANREENGIGGHISSYASAATLYEVGFNHFFRGKDAPDGADLIYFQGHITPGIYARAYLEGRLSIQQLENFRRELHQGGGLSSYPHPWLMPEFWEFPTVSMGLGPIMSIYQARFNRYLENRGFKKPSNQKVWAFLGDGETDEPETLGAITLASREKLDNLIFVINCNLQRLDGPVRGNGKIVQELEGIFRGAGWNVIKVLWGSHWDNLIAKDSQPEYGGALLQRFNETLDGEWQKYSVEGPAYSREHFFGKDPRLVKMIDGMSDEELALLNRGGHDPLKVYAAYKAATEHRGAPTVILAKTIKGYGMGESGEGKNITHQQKKLNESELKEFRRRFDIPISENEAAKAPFYQLPENSAELKYLKKRRQALGGPVPKRNNSMPRLELPEDAQFEEFYLGSEEREVSTTMVLVRIVSKLLRHAKFGKQLVPIIPDEARTFGMEGLFRQFGIYSHVGQLYEPVDASSLLYYKEAKDGQILEEGITEAGSMSSFIAAGTSHATHGVTMVPFFIYYSMFGFQRIGDLIWAAADMRCRGFLIGGTAGRTTLAGEGLQHQDGHSHLIAYSVPTIMAYDPAFAFEVAVIVRDGLKRMYDKQENIFYYLTVGNENYPMPPMPKGVEDGILKGLYRFKASEKNSSAAKSPARAHLFGSGAIINEVLRAKEILEKEFDVATDVWSITSYKELHRDGIETERWNMLNPTLEARTTYLSKCLKETDGVYVLASDYVKALPNSIARWFPKAPVVLGTDGFGRSEGRSALRDFFEVDTAHIVLATLTALHREKKIHSDAVKKALKKFNLSNQHANPLTS
jgi:pyruvate dehydrogenase E1 component